MKHKFTKKNFKTWLESFGPNEVVGKSRTPTECPMATFVKSYGHKYSSVGIFVIHGIDDLTFSSFPAPIWADKFITKIDKMGTKITAKSALEILDSI